MRAKLELLNKQKNSYTYSNSGKSVEEETEDVFQDEEITTFRLLKKGSVNTELEGATYRNIWNIQKHLHLNADFIACSYLT